MSPIGHARLAYINDKHHGTKSDASGLSTTLVLLRCPSTRPDSQVEYGHAGELTYTLYGKQGAAMSGSACYVLSTSITAVPKQIMNLRCEYTKYVCLHDSWGKAVELLSVHA